jgi:UDP-N-acetylglucosamine 2-epimerase (non-hydrolysing)
MVKKILVIFGTRPEAIKMAPVISELMGGFEVKICVTAQHREMLDQVLNLFSIKPDYDLSIMRERQNLFQVTANVLNGLNEIISKEQPDLVLVHGDTTTSMAASMAAFYHQIEVGHVEAGLRTNNIYSPFPEEMNRQLVSKIATLHFAPTESSKENLVRENVKKENIYVTGNTVIDALFMSLDKARAMNIELTPLKNIRCLFDSSMSGSKIILVTGHR